MKIFHRERERQISRINLEFWSLVRGFEESLFTNDWHSNRDPNYPIYRKYAEIWESYCRHYRIGYKRIVFPNPDAFRIYAFDNLIDTILPGAIDPQQIDGQTKETRPTGQTETSD